jgi:hypothetical protein
MSAPTVSSISADKVFDRAMGHGCATSGGRGTRKYALQMTRRDRERLESATKLAEVAEKKKVASSKLKVSELMHAADAGELDWM